MAQRRAQHGQKGSRRQLNPALRCTPEPVLEQSTGASRWSVASLPCLPALPCRTFDPEEAVGFRGYGF